MGCSSTPLSRHTTGTLQSSRAQTEAAPAAGLFIPVTFLFSSGQPCPSIYTCDRRHLLLGSSLLLCAASSTLSTVHSTDLNIFLKLLYFLFPSYTYLLLIFNFLVIEKSPPLFLYLSNV